MLGLITQQHTGGLVTGCLVIYDAEGDIVVAEIVQGSCTLLSRTVPRQVRELML